ncbi:MAG: methionine synthase [Candidatus Methanomethylicia archaeon]|jgi:5-methyltetrahydropteroyltriglutamate--homocysteine methyltransferase|uniref:Methionine synthase n=1 Tax=Thermoproteota archaeon TaxID=2056631 RepID=A0A523BB01_9CREN|nr:methionine synthase [Candidatus Methanomethylicia archaeon]TDA38129.1 MAG: methionine synthase [Candidatus Verstraetearchaeota archaeon]
MKTTVIGSYPVVGEGLEAIKNAVKDQLDAGIEIISDGQTRKDMVCYFADHIPGFKVEDEKAKIVGRIRPPEETPVVEDLIFARELAGSRAEVKAIITGPVTMVFFSELTPEAPYAGFRDERLYEDVSAALAVEAEIMQKSGFLKVQIDEPSFSIGAPMNIGRKVLEAIVSDLKGVKALHVCGNLRRAFKEIVKIEGFDVLSFSFKDNVSNFDNVERKLLEDYSKRLGVGCVSTMSPEAEDVESIKKVLSRALELYGVENIEWIHPDCGLRSLKRDEAFTKLKNMVTAAKELRV